jgi:hypothetical protein
MLCFSSDRRRQRLRPGRAPFPLNNWTENGGEPSGMVRVQEVSVGVSRMMDPQ